MKELVGIILLTVLVVFGSCNSNTNVSLVGTSRNYLVYAK